MADIDCYLGEAQGTIHSKLTTDGRFHAAPEPIQGTRTRGGMTDVAELLSAASVISFDVFDTLLIRRLHDPTDVFELIERHTGIAGFRRARCAAEHETRNKSFVATESREVTLEEIYRNLRLPKTAMQTPALRHEALLQLELETERSLLVKSPSIGGIYGQARATGKPIVAISDMYLPADFISALLADNGVPVDAVFVSSEHRCSKHEGGLYAAVADKLGVMPGQIVHFGDNFQADCAAALEAGVVGYHLPAVSQQLSRDTKFNTACLSQLEGLCASSVEARERNLFASLLLAHMAIFKAENPLPSAAGLFGAMYGGPLVASFATWLRLMMRTDNVAHMRLAARDGFITEAVWRALGFNEKASVLHMSRRLALLPALARDFDGEVHALLATSTTLTLRQSIERLNLADATPLLEALAARTAIDRPLDTPVKIKNALDALRECADLIKRIADEESRAYKTYLKNEGFEPETDALADCGWAISSQRRLEVALGSRLRGYYIGTLAHAHMHEGIKSFLFHKGQNKKWVAIAENAVELLELPFAAIQAQILRFEQQFDVDSPAPVCVEHAPHYEAVRAVFVREMQSEILKFSRFIAPFIEHVTIEEMREVLLCLFEALVWTPTAFEYHELASVPHDREYGRSEFATIGTFWKGAKMSSQVSYSKPSAQPRMRDYVRVGWLSLRQSGWNVTLERALRVLRRRIRTL